MTLSIAHLDLGKEYRGGQRQVFYLLSAQLSRGLKVGLISRKNSPLLKKVKKEFSQIKTLALGSGEFNPISLTRLGFWLKKNNFNILHTHEAKAAGLAFWVSKGLPSIKIIHTRRVSYPFNNWWSKKKYTSGYIVGVSQEICSYFKQEGFPEQKIFCIPSCLDLKRYYFREKELNFPVIIGIIGALSPQKGHEIVLPYIKKIPFAYKLLVVGSGVLENKLKNMVVELGLEKKVDFLGFQESNKILPKLDVLLVPSVDGEGSSGVIKEGWACKVPVIASDLKANLELIKPYENGLIFPLNKPETLVDLLVELIEDRDLYFRLKQKGLRDVLNFQIDKMEEKYFQVYQQLEKV